MADLTLEAVPPEEAIKYFRRKGYKVGFDWRDVATETHAQAFTVAKAMQLDILEDIRGALDDALSGGTTFEQFKKELAPALKAKGWWGKSQMLDPKTGELRPVQLGSARRLRIIFDANIRSAHAAGHWKQIQRVKHRRPYLRYVAILDDRTRPEHRAWHGLIRPVDDPIWRTLYPPNGWRCRCQVQQLSRRDLDRYGWTVSDKPDLPLRSWTNKRTGETIRVPKGIDPGWQQNAGHNYQKHLEQQVAEKLETIAQAASSMAIRDMISSPEFDTLRRGRFGGSIPVGLIDDAIRKQLRAETRTVKFSDQTARKQLIRHPDVQAGDYLLVNEIIRRGEALMDGADNIIFQASIAGKLWRVVVKSTKDNQELFLTTFHRISETHRRRAVIRAKKIREAN